MFLGLLLKKKEEFGQKQNNLCLTEQIKNKIVGNLTVNLWRKSPVAHRHNSDIDIK